MSEMEPEDDRSESYLEIQMDRSTIVLAALGLLALLAASFLLGSWFGSRSDDAAPAAEASAAGASLEAEPAEHDSEDVAAEDGFGGKAVSAAGAPPVGAVPPPGRRDPAGGSAASAPVSLAEELVPSPRASAPKPTAASRAKPSAPARATATAPSRAAAKASAPAKATVAAPAKATAVAKPTAAPASDAWVVQVAAGKDRREADQLAARLRAKGHAVRVIEEEGLVKVQVGPFDSKTEAQAAERRLAREEKVPTWLKRG